DGLVRPTASLSASRTPSLQMPSAPAAKVPSGLSGNVLEVVRSVSGLSGSIWVHLQMDSKRSQRRKLQAEQYLRSVPTTNRQTSECLKGGHLGTSGDIWKGRKGVEGRINSEKGELVRQAKDQ